MEGAPLNEADHCGDPPLLLAAGNGHKAVCELLLEEGADVEQRNVMGESPLIRYVLNIGWMGSAATRPPHGNTHDTGSYGWRRTGSWAATLCSPHKNTPGRGQSRWTSPQPSPDPSLFTLH
jgi:hypothetical protein